MGNKLFSKSVEKSGTIYRFFGIKIFLKNREFERVMSAETKRCIEIQDSYDLEPLKNAKNLILFLIPVYVRMCGGIMSIFSLCETSRELNPDSVCILSTFPNDIYTYAYNDYFKNDEKIYRFFQIVKNCKNVENLIIHIPEYYAKSFCKDIGFRNRQYLKSIKNLQINILNQNIDIMPIPEKIKKLNKLTNNITQTVAHNSYATQEVCDKWQIPTHLFSVNIPLDKYKRYSFEEKEKIIALSNDLHPCRDKIIKLLEKEFPDYKLITINNMTFSEYMDIIAKSYFTITFGEGFDGYFTQPQYVGGLGFAAYNDTFFPSEDWKKLINVYRDYDEMYSNIVSDFKKLINDKNLYYESINKSLNEQNKLYSTDGYIDNLKRFYKQEYDFYPNKENIEQK